MKTRIMHVPYGKGEKITILSKNGNIEGIIYIDSKGKVHCDSWMGISWGKQRPPKEPRKEYPKKPFNPSRRDTSRRDMN